MASIDRIYTDLNRLYKLAEEINASNYDSSADLLSQAERLDEIIELASTNAPLLNKIDKVLES